MAVRYNHVLSLISTAYLLIYPILTFTILFNPTVIFSGSASGYVSFYTYQIRVIGFEVHSELYDALPIYSTPILLSAVISILTFILHIKRYRLESPKINVILSITILNIVVLGYEYGLINLIYKEAGLLSFPRINTS
ncbi:hypothetical protein DRN87_01975, partial [Candidatus Geothermarchaeota archaeon]